MKDNHKNEYDMGTKFILFFTFVALPPLANYLIKNVGTVCVNDGPCLIPVGLGLLAPSGVLLIGLALVLRDMLQEAVGLPLVLLAVLLGTVISWGSADPSIAGASAVAFLFAELVDLIIYTPLRKKGLHTAVLVSGVFGAFVDSFIFVYLAFGALDFSAGNTLGKLYATAAFALYLYLRRSRK